MRNYSLYVSTTWSPLLGSWIMLILEPTHSITHLLNTARLHTGTTFHGTMGTLGGEFGLSDTGTLHQLEFTWDFGNIEIFNGLPLSCNSHILPHIIIHHILKLFHLLLMYMIMIVIQKIETSLF